MSKNNGTKIHTNVLVMSAADDVALGHAVEERFLQLCQDYLRTKGEELVFPTYLSSDVYLWRSMRVRHKSGDFRNTKDELKATKRVAEWTLRVKQELCEQEKIQIEWDH